MRSRAIAGFTLVEMMIVVAIIGILAAIAYPSYREHVLRGNRAEGMALLNDAAARQERYFAQTNTYVTAQADIGKLGFTASGESFQVTSSTGKYSLAVSAPNDAGGYLLTSTPQGAQAADTKCGNLTLNAKGTRGISATSTAVSDCWR